MGLGLYIRRCQASLQDHSPATCSRASLHISFTLYGDVLEYLYAENGARVAVIITDRHARGP